MAENRKSIFKSLLMTIKENDEDLLQRGLEERNWNIAEKSKGLLVAARLGYSGCFKLLLSADANLKKYGNGNLDIVKQIVSKMDDISTRSSSRLAKVARKSVVLLQQRDLLLCTALYYAAERGQHDVVRELISAGVDVNQTSLTDAVTPLMVACDSGHSETVSQLILAGADVNKPDHHKQHALFYAARSGKVDCLQLLLNANCKVNLLSNLNQTALTAAAHASAECIQLLLNSGCNSSIVDVYGYTALAGAIHARNDAAIQILLDDFKEKHLENVDLSVHVAARRNSPHILRKLFEYGWDLTRKSPDARTLLHSACAEVAIDSVQFLLEPAVAGFPAFDVNARCERDCVPLNYACKRHCPEIVSLLLKHDALILWDSNCGSDLPLYDSVATIVSARYLPEKYTIAKELLRYQCYQSPECCRPPFVRAATYGNLCLIEMFLVAKFPVDSDVLDACGQYFPEGHSRRKALDLVLSAQTTLQSLRVICRNVIRKVLNTNIVRKSPLLELPKLLSEFLLLPELDAIEEKYSEEADNIGPGGRDIIRDEDEGWSTMSDSSSLSGDGLSALSDSDD